MHKLVTPNELIMLKKYASQARIGIVEIGVLDGGTTRELIASSNVPVYGIDPLVADSNDPNLVGSMQLISEIDSDRFMFIHDYSYNAIHKFKYGFDMIFIDGDHNSDAVKRDFYDWNNTLEVGGYILFHDTTINRLRTGKPGPAKFINEEMMYNNHFGLIDGVDSLKVFKRII